MNLGVLLSSGDSITDMNKFGQAGRFRASYLNYFSKSFKKVYLFSYANEKVTGLPRNVVFVPNKYNLHRYIYGFLMPFISFRAIRDCNVFRAYHLIGTLPAIIIRIFFRKPFVFNFAFDYYNFAKIEGQTFQKWMIKIIMPISISLASLVFAANSKIYQSLNTPRKAFLPNGVDVNIFKPNKYTNDQENVILSVGRLEKQKNFLNLIRALTGLKVKLIIVGFGSQKSKLFNLVEKNMLSFENLSKIENTKMPKLYNQASIFILPSLIEGHPKALLEAMACGRPVIGSDVDGINDVIVDNANGLFCQTSSKSIRRVVTSLLGDSYLRERLGKAARRTILRKFSLGKLLKQEVKLIKLQIR